MDLDTLSNTSCITEIAKALSIDSPTDELSSSSETSKLWSSYQQMIKVAMKLIKADQTGSWQMHLDAILEALPIFTSAGHSNYLKSSYLYLQKMKSLEKQNPKVFHKFMNGFHVIRRTNQYWAGLGSDLVIEQTFMRFSKSTGGLTQGSDMTEHQELVGQCVLRYQQHTIMQCRILQTLSLQEVSSTKRQCCHGWRETGQT